MGCFLWRELGEKNIKLLKEHYITMGYTVYGYVIMDNHYHLVIQTFDKKLQEIMHQINNKYSKYFNNKYKRVGHVFQGRYKAILVQDERYILKLIRYIYKNPVRAGICRSMEDYKWSSDIYYRKNIKSFIYTAISLEMFDKNIENAVKAYKEFMKEEEETEYSKLDKIGEEAYQILCKSKKEAKQRKRLDEILIEAAETIEIFQLIKTGSRKRILTEYKTRYILKAKEQGYTLKEIGKNIGITAVSAKELIDKYR